MSSSRLQAFRGLITERFTAVAVEIFGEVENMVEDFYEENKRLRNILHMVLNPEIKLSRIDVNQYRGETTVVREQPPEPDTGLDLEIPEPLPKKPKEEQTEYNINWEHEKQPGLGEADNYITPDCVKDDIKEEEICMPRIVDSFHLQVVEDNPDTSATVSGDEVNSFDEEQSSLESDADTDTPQLFMSKKSKYPQQKTMLELPRLMPYRSISDGPPNCQAFLERLTEAFRDFPEDEKPLISKMGLTADVKLVDSALGKVPKGCPLSYQCPVPSSQDFTTHDDAPSRPVLPLSRHILAPLSIVPTLSIREQELINIIHVTWEEAHNLELSTRECKEGAEELRQLRLTSRFREICKLKPGRSHAEHVIFKIQKGSPKSKSAQMDEEMKTQALREYCRHLCVNWSPCGLVVHPNAPWLGALPDGLVYDPKERTSFGLVHTKSIQCRSFVSCKFLVSQEGVLLLRKRHPYYWHIQGEMMVTGTSWCDLLVFSKEDMLIQRIYRDNVIIKIMKKKLDEFFFYYYLPTLTTSKH